MLLEWFAGFHARADEISVHDGDTIHWRRGGWGADGKQADGTRKFRLAYYDAPELGEQAKSAREAEWAEEARRFLKRRIEEARHLRIKPIGHTRWEDTEVAVLYLNGRDIKEIMIEAGMGMPVAWDDNGHFIRPNWDKLTRWPGAKELVRG